MYPYRSRLALSTTRVRSLLAFRRPDALRVAVAVTAEAIPLIDAVTVASAMAAPRMSRNCGSWCSITFTTPAEVSTSNRRLVFARSCFHAHVITSTGLADFGAYFLMRYLPLGRWPSGRWNRRQTCRVIWSAVQPCGCA
jgi:hypothetical protein